jgi:putrescine aminotransferase
MTTTDDILGMDADHLIRFNTPVGTGATIAIERAEGVWLYDTEGNRYLDGRSQLNCVNLGHSHPSLVRAINEQAEKLQYLSTFYQFTHPLAAKVAARLAGLLPAKLNHVAFSSGGFEANEMAFMIARLYWSKEQPTKTKIISRINGYHGNTAQTMSATGMAMGGQNDIQNIVPGHVRIPAPYMYRSDETDEETYAETCAQHLAAMIESEGPETVAAFIAEPIVGVGGYFTPPAGYWPKIREICDHYDVLLILDEVMTGFCRTGQMFAADLYDVEPDLLTMGKGINSSYLPCGALGISDRIVEVIQGSSLSGFTHAGHPLAMAAVDAALDVYVDEDVAGTVRVMSGHVQSRFRDEFMELDVVGDVDGEGLMLALEIVENTSTKARFGAETMARITSRSLDRGLITRARGSRLAFCPPLTITRDEADQALDIMFNVLGSLRDG